VFTRKPVFLVVSSETPSISKVGIYLTLRFWIPFPDRYTGLPISYRDLGILIFHDNSDYVGCVDGAPLAFAPSVTHCNGHHMTPTVPTARLGTPPDQRHDLDRARPGLACTRPFAPASLNQLRAKPRHLFLTHQGTHIDSKLLAHPAANKMTQRKLGGACVGCGHRASWCGAGGSVCQTREACELKNVSWLVCWSV